MRVIDRQLTARQRFVQNIQRAAGSDVRVCWTPRRTDKAVSFDELGNLITWDADPSARITPLGKGYQQSFDGVGQRGVMADQVRHSFGIGTADIPRGFSVLVLANVTDTAAARILVGKMDAAVAALEWSFHISSADTLQFQLFDQSAGVGALRATTGAITQAAWKLFSGTYSAATGGATAADDMLLWQDAAQPAQGATNNAGYVAMENLGTGINIGARGGTGTFWFAGSEAFVLVAGGVINPTQQREIKNLCNWFFGLTL